MTTPSDAAIEAVKRGPVEILCLEAKYPFDPEMEDTALFIEFVRVLFSHINDMVAWRSAISRMVPESGWDTNEARQAFQAVKKFIIDGDPTIDRETQCFVLHNELFYQPDDGPYNRIIEMLSSIVSAIRFGLEVPCHSRHAAHAAGHIWEHKYGIRLFDECTSDWQKDWMRRQIGTAREQWKAEQVGKVG